MERPRLKGHYTTQVVSSTRLFVVAEDHSFMIQDEAAVKILPYLDGRHTVADIAEALATELSISQILLALRRYETLGTIADGRPELPAAEMAYWDALGVDAVQVSDRLPAEVALTAVGAVDVRPFDEALRSAGVSCTALDVAADRHPTLAVVVADDYLATPLAELNRTFLGDGIPWLLVKPTGVGLWLGPLFRPGHTGCWACLRQRLQANRQVNSYLATKRDDATSIPIVRGALPASWVAAAALTAPEVVQILATGTSPRLEGSLVTIDRKTLASTEHTLIRQPQCPACGDPGLETRRDPRVVLRPCGLRFRADGGYRTEPPDVTYQRLRKHISPLIGAVSSLRSLDESPTGLTHSYVAAHPFAVIGDNMCLLRRNLRGQSGGKGRTDVQARVSGIAEAIERYCGVWRGTEPVLRACYDELGPDRAVHPGELLLYSENQYAHRVDWNEHGAGRLHIVPDPFRTDVPCDWTAVWSLTHDRPRMVTSAYAWFGHPDLNDHFFAFADANGNAAGSVLEEAVLQGLCELIERDSVALWWYNRARRPAFDPDTLDDPYIEQLRRYYRTVDRELWMLDITADLGVPAFAAVSHRFGGPTEDIILGFGAHPDPRIAAMRAITEVNQFLPMIVQRNPDGSTRYWEDDPAVLEWMQTARLDEEPWLLPDERQPRRTLADFESLVGEDLTADLQTVLDRVHRAGLEVLVADQSRPDLDLAVVKVMVPGLRHFWRRLAPGRLYEVPAKLGWLPRQLAEDELNPKNVFF